MIPYRKALEAAGISQLEVVHQAAIAAQILRESGHAQVGMELAGEQDPEDGSYSVVVTLHFVGTLDDELKLGAALARRLADLPSWDPCRLLVDIRGRRPRRPRLH